MQVEMAKELLEDGGQDLTDMTVTEYLRRLNLSQYAPAFSKKKVYFLSDLRFHTDEGAMESQFGIKDLMLQKRIVNMINGDKQVALDFALLSHNQARQIIKQFVMKAELQEQLVDLVETDALSGFQLKDICTNNYDFDSIKAAIVAAVKESKLYENPNAMTINLIQEDEDKTKEEEESDDEKKARIGFPSHDIEDLMNELGLQDKIEKLKENEIDAELFWELTDEALKDTLEVKIHGQRKRLLKRIEDIKKEHEKAMETKHEEAKRLNTDGIHFMLKG